MAGEESAQPRQFRPQRGSMTETIVSGIAATLTTAAFVPQAYKIIQGRETAGVSLWMHVTFAVGVAFWFVLGVLIWNWPMMIANVVTFILTLVIVGMKLYLK
jgi:MtN3 and saliva related transmembrane protein